ncbi:MAG: ATP-binding cassette domain-containing protein [Gemmatimonadota bacterium]|nr:ATP-binding cassette domain-containing protein [Gemmatimonadota bacterium]
MRGITKYFGNLEALSAVSFRLRRGSLHALLGENGAGKTTLMRLAFGMISPDAGDVQVGGVSRRIHSPRDAITLGIGMVHQHFMLVPEMTVAENIELGGRGRFDAHASARKLQVLKDKTGLEVDPSAKVSSLGIPAQQRVEIIKALANNAEVLILDEPTAVLAPAEAQDLLARIRELVLHGTSVVLITHKLRDARQYADDVSVLRHGRMVLTGPITDFSEQQLAAQMLGRKPHTTVTQVRGNISPAGESVISLREVDFIDSSGVRRLQSVNLEVGAGEIVGIAALEGSAVWLLRILAGRFTPTQGRRILPERIGFIAEDRRHDGLVATFTLYENVALKDIGKRKGRMRWPAIKQQTLSLIKRFDVRASGIDMRAQNLSGGNQQKLVLARELDDSPNAIIAENPTRGLDINASLMIHEHLRRARDTGCAVVFYSSDIDELVDLADRVVVLREGTLVQVPLEPGAIGNALLASRNA